MSLPAGVQVLERGWLSANNIVFVGEQGTAVVDTGYCTHEAQTVTLVTAALGGRPLDAILNTHLHSDHCGGNAALQARFPGAGTSIPPGLARHVIDWDPVALTYGPTGQQCPRFRIDGLLRPGERVALGDLDWEIHAAPGHDPHSVILFEPRSRTLLSADALWRNGFGVVFQELEGDDAFDEVAGTLDLIERLSPLTVIPGHGPVFSDVSDALSAARRRLDGFLADPRKHAQHAAKVLLKFKLLELQSVAMPRFLSWAAGTPYFAMVRDRFFPDRPLDDWLRDLTAELVRAGAAAQSGEQLANI